jgi:hypothetical protein
MPLARTNSERAELRTRITKKPYAEVESDVDTLFQTGKRPDNSLGALLLPHEDREGIAHLLFGLNNKPEDQPRLQVILGLRALDDEISRQVSALHTMAEQAAAVNMHDRTNFEVAHRTLTHALRAEADFLTNRKHALEGHIREKNRHQELLDSRKTEVQQVIDATEASRARLQTSIAAQRAEEGQIFQAQQLYERTKRDNEQLERDIRNLEKVDGEGKKR